AADATPDLDIVDGARLRSVEELQRRVARVQKHRMSAIVFERGHLFQAQRVAKERDRRVKVVHRKNETELFDLHESIVKSPYFCGYGSSFKVMILNGLSSSSISPFCHETDSILRSWS